MNRLIIEEYYILYNRKDVNMKKFSKFIFGTISVAALAGGVIYFFKNVLNKDSSDDFEDFEDDFEDFDMDDEEEDTMNSVEDDSRGYVKINLDDTDEELKADHQSSSNEPITEDAVMENIENEVERDFKEPSKEEEEEDIV